MATGSLRKVAWLATWCCAAVTLTLRRVPGGGLLARHPRLGTLAVAGSALMAGAVTCANHSIVKSAQARTYRDASTVPARYAIIIPGAAVYGDMLSDVLEDRLETGLAAYRAGRGQRFLVSGDHGRPEYDEVRAMKRWLLAHGVPEDRVFMDHAGFRTLDTMVRARQVFQVTGAIVVTQEFHLARSLYLAAAAGIDAVGIIADRRPYIYAMNYAIREALARTMCWLDVARGREPRYLGAVVPITGSAALTDDRP